MELQCASLCVAQQATASPLGSLSAKTDLWLTHEATVKLIQNSSGDLAHQHDVQLSSWSRIEASEAYDQAAGWLAGKARAFGLQQVEL
jgi:hypothetical protein